MMHRSRSRAVALLALLAVPLVARAQSGPSAGEAPAVTAYHTGARQFIAGDIPAAAATVDAALAATPNDARLRALRELIRQQQQDGGGGGEDEPDDSDTSAPDQNAPPEPGDGGPPDAPPDDPGDAPGGPPPPTDPGGAGGAPGRPQGMSRAEAEALLDAVGGEERLLLRELRREAAPGRRPERDW